MYSSVHRRAPWFVAVWLLVVGLVACGEAVATTGAPLGGSPGATVAVAGTPAAGAGTAAAAGTPATVAVTATRGATNTRVAGATPPVEDCSRYIPRPVPGPTPTRIPAPPPSLELAVAHAEVVVFPEYDEQACVATLHLRVTVTNRGTAPVFIREQFLLDSDGYVARTIHPLMDGLAQRTEERVFTVAGVEIAPGASATRSIVVDTLRKADRYTLGYERYEDRKFTLVAVPLDVSAAIARALAAPSRAIGPPPAATPTPNIQLTYDPPIAGPGAVIKVRGSGFTVPPLLRGNGPDGAAELDLVIEVVGNTPPRLSELPRSITANPDGTFVYDLSANTLGPGQYAIVVTYYGPGVETYRGPVLTITAP